MAYILKNNSKSNFTSISNTFLNDTDLSLSAKGLGSFLLSKPKDWVVNPHHLSKEFRIGRDTIRKYINELIVNGYMYKSKYIIFAKKGEQSVFYHISDCKEKLYNEVILKEMEEQSLQLPLPVTEFPLTENPLTITPLTENPSLTKNIVYKENNIQKNTTTNLDDYLNTYLDKQTKATLLKVFPLITLNKFIKLYNRCLEEKKAGYANNVNACLILAAQNRWTFRTSPQALTSTDDKISKVLTSKVLYFESLYKEAGVNYNEVLSLFRKDCSKYPADTISHYENILIKKIK